MADSAARGKELKAQRQSLLQGRQGISTGSGASSRWETPHLLRPADTWTGDPSVKPIYTFHLQTGLSHINDCLLLVAL